VYVMCIFCSIITQCTWHNFFKALQYSKSKKYFPWSPLWNLSMNNYTKMAVFRVVAPCSLVEVYQRFRGPCCLHHQDNDPTYWITTPSRNQQITDTDINQLTALVSICVTLFTERSTWWSISQAPTTWPTHQETFRCILTCHTIITNQV
jgi:hypothetical protein